jgi:hypothetical protein
MVRISFWLMPMMLTYWEEAYILYRNNTKNLVVATKEIGLEVNIDKTKYMVMSRDRNAGRDDRVKINNTSIDRVDEFKNLEKIAIFKLTEQAGSFYNTC